MKCPVCDGKKDGIYCHRCYGSGYLQDFGGHTTKDLKESEDETRFDNEMEEKHFRPDTHEDPECG